MQICRNKKATTNARPVERAGNSALESAPHAAPFAFAVVVGHLQF